NIKEVVGKNTEKMTEQLKNEGLKVTVIGDGNRIDSSNIREGEEIFSNDHVFLVTDKPKMPNIKGWSLREVLQLSHLLDLQIETVGEGYVSIQSIEKGSPIKPGDYLGVELKLPKLPKDKVEDED